MSEKPTEDGVPSVPPECLAEAMELSRAAEVLPHGVHALAERLHLSKTGGRPLRVKLGVDPTGCDLHLGHTVVLRRLRMFQDRGHQAILVIGGMTAQIGDPTGRNQARPALTAEAVAANAATFLEQVRHILDCDRLEVRNNADWFSDMPLPQVLRLAAQVTVNRLIAKDSFGLRLEQNQPLGLHEVFYPLLQGFDSVVVEADLEIGGTDQRFNILQGRDLQTQNGQLPQLGLLLPLLEGTDGKKKMSKSADNFIGLQEPAEVIFAKAMRLPDALVGKFLQLATALPAEEVQALELKLQPNGDPKAVKQKLAWQLVNEVHGGAVADRVMGEWDRVHTQRLVPEVVLEHAITEPILLTKLLIQLAITDSGNKGRQLIKGGGVRLDGQKVENELHTVALPPAQGVLLQVGRRHFVRLVSGAN